MTRRRDFHAAASKRCILSALVWGILYFPGFSPIL
jgi:hypothetical protein